MAVIAETLNLQRMEVMRKKRTETKVGRRTGC